MKEKKRSADVLGGRGLLTFYSTWLIILRVAWTEKSISSSQFSTFFFFSHRDNASYFWGRHCRRPVLAISSSTGLFFLPASSFSPGQIECIRSKKSIVVKAMAAWPGVAWLSRQSDGVLCKPGHANIMCIVIWLPCVYLYTYKAIL